MSKNFQTTQQTIHGYWTNKEDRAKQALSHHNLMKTLYAFEIEHSIADSVIYSSEAPKIKEVGNPRQIFKNVDSVGALFSTFDVGDKLCVLNFASYKHPGGGFLAGSSAQEESLCMESTLYEVIGDDHFKSYYDWNNKNLNRALYTNRAIYSPDIIFTRDKKVVADVLTCAAPNIGAAHHWQKVSYDENTMVLKRRMQFIADILAAQKVNVAVLGGFGCGVFGQDANEVAEIWKNLTYGKDLKLIVHAVPFTGENPDAFKKVFGEFRNE